MRYIYGVTVGAILSVLGNRAESKERFTARFSCGLFVAPCARRQRLQEELRELQIRLDGANMLAGQLEREISDCQQR